MFAGTVAPIALFVIWHHRGALPDQLCQRYIGRLTPAPFGTRWRLTLAQGIQGFHQIRLQPR